jgi:hypothetical protein
MAKTTFTFTVDEEIDETVDIKLAAARHDLLEALMYLDELTRELYNGRTGSEKFLFETSHTPGEFLMAEEKLTLSTEPLESQTESDGQNWIPSDYVLERIDGALLKVRHILNDVF